MVLDLEPDHPQRMKLLNLLEKYAGGAKMTVGPVEKTTAEKVKSPEKPKLPSPKK
jgi:hypothetical protein